MLYYIILKIKFTTSIPINIQQLTLAAIHLPDYFPGSQKAATSLKTGKIARIFKNVKNIK